MTAELPLPRFAFRPDQPSLWTLLRHGIDDVGSTIPAAILDRDAVQLPGGGAPLVVASPDLARLVLNDRADQFDRDRLIRRLFRRSWGKGLAAAEGEDWQAQRRAVVPALRPQVVAAYLGDFSRAADQVAEATPTVEPVELTWLAARIISRIVFSALVAAPDWVDRDAAARDVPGYLRALTRFGLADLMPLPEAWIDALRGVNRAPPVKRLRALARQIAAARVPGRQHDMVALLEGVGPVADNICGMFPAAMDTTVAGASWALHTLAHRPGWQDCLAAEAMAAGDNPTLEQLPLTRQVVQEVLRLYPPGPLLARCAAQDMELGGLAVRRGQTVIVCIYALHRHRSVWEEPDRFDPARFAQGVPHREAYLPFGTGPRMCVAAHFATAEIVVLLARLLARFELHPLDHQPQLSLRVSTHSVNGLPVRLTRR